MLHSLRFRLLIATLLIVVVSVSVMAVFASQRTVGEFRDFAAHNDRLQQQALSQALSRAYAQEQDWQDLQPIVSEWSQANGQRIVVTDPQGRVLIDSGNDLMGQIVGGRPWPPPSGFILLHGTSVGAFYINPKSAPPPPARTDFTTAIYRSVLLGALIAGAVAVVITLFVSRRIVQPVESLTAAARQMEKGDLTTRVNVKSSDEIGQLAGAFNAMADGLAKQEQLRRNMVSDVAHELRTPLTNLRGYLEAAKDGLIQPDEALVDNLHEEAMLLSRLVNDLQELALAEAGQLHLECQPVSVGDVAQALVEVLSPLASTRDISLVVHLPDDLPLVQADPHHVRQILRNLLNNALDFVPQGGQVTVTAQPDGKWLKVEVCDTGPGIKPAHLPYVFERFYRADPSRTRATGGAGLGLAIVKQLVEAHGGRVWVESTPGAGATFGFTLPLASN
jgi:signal transduction histidine kinase